MQVEPHPEPRLVDLEERGAATMQKKRIIRGSLFANLTTAVGLRALAGVQRRAGYQELRLAEPTDAFPAPRPATARSRPAWRSRACLLLLPRPLLRSELELEPRPRTTHVAHPRDTELRPRPARPRCPCQRPAPRARSSRAPGSARRSCRGSPWRDHPRGACDTSRASAPGRPPMRLQPRA